MRRHRNTGNGVHMDDAPDIRPSSQDPAVKDEAGAIDASRFIQVGVHIDPHEVRGGHLPIEQGVRLDEEMPRRTGHPQAQMVVDAIGGRKKAVDHPIGRSKILPRRPFSTITLCHSGLIILHANLIGSAIEAGQFTGDLAERYSDDLIRHSGKDPRIASITVTGVSILHAEFADGTTLRREICCKAMHRMS